MSKDLQKNDFNRGSTWRKWDLHVHTPDTKLNKEGYENSKDKDGNSIDKWDLFCQKIEESDVSVFGIADYFSVENYFVFVEKFKAKYPNSKKVFFPNIEFRTESKNSKDEHIQFHILFSNNKNTLDKINNFFTRLKLVSTDNENLTNKYCTSIDLSSVGYDKAMVKIDELEEKLQNDFTDDEYLIVGVANGYGSLRPNGATDGRGSEYAKELDKKCKLFFGGSKNTNFFLNKDEGRKQYILPPKPVVFGCDSHSFDILEKKLGKSFEEKNEQEEIKDYAEITWIKADPTFEGLKQIIFEPEDRVKIQPNIPDDKTGYYVIDRIEINHQDVANKEILLNENLNTIIGGRSTGKSIFLAAIATKLKLENEPVFKGKDKEEYKKYIDEIKNTIKIFWKDGQEKYEREVEYFQQGYMYDLSNNKEKLNTVIQNILKKKGKEKILEDFKNFTSSNSKEIETGIGSLFQISRDIKENNQKLLDKGDKIGVENEIKKLEAEKQKNSTIQIAENEKIEYETLKTELENIQNEKKKNIADYEFLTKLSASSFVKNDIDYDLFQISNNDRKTNLKNIFSTLKTEFIQKWDDKVSEIKTEIEKRNKTIEEREKEIEENASYKKVNSAFKESEQIQEIEKRLQIEKVKLGEIETLNTKVSELQKQAETLKNKILENYKKFFSETEEVVKNLSSSVDGLEISAKFFVNEKKYKEVLESALHNGMTENKKYLPGNLYEISNIFHDLLEEKLPLKGGYSHENLAKSILIENYYEIHYELIYENDSFGQMSDGKKAFVVLKLLLDFSDKECPILIDQPEDDLDNRSIFNQLVQYLKQKKIKRQIIVATHNSNVVVTADAEEVIVANQHGTNSSNQDSKKFQYISGSLENTKTFNEILAKTSILDSQGVQQHVCDILEGGKIAFEQRKKKYNF